MEEIRSDWKSLLGALPPEAFFRIVRLYLGPVETPFHKPRLVEELVAFVSRPEHRQRIREWLDQEDLLILSSFLVLEAPRDRDIHGFFQGEWSYLSIHYRLLNLEERLLVLRQGSSGRFALSPFFQSPDFSGLLSRQKLFPLSPLPPGSPDQPLLMEREHFLVYYALIREDSRYLSALGKPRKKFIQRLQEIPAPPGDPEWYLRTMILLGLVQRGEESCVIHDFRWDDLFSLSATKAQALIWAGALYSREAHSGASTPSSKDLLALASWLWRLWERIPPGKGLAKAVLTRWLRIHGPGHQVPEALLLEGLKELGLLVESPGALLSPRDKSQIQALVTSDEVDSNVGSEPGAGSESSVGGETGDARESGRANPAQGLSAHLESSGELTLDAGFPLKTQLEISRFARLESWGRHSRWQINRSSLSPYWTRGRSSRQLAEFLETLCGRPAASGLRVFWEESERAYLSLRAMRGTIISADPHRSAVLEQSSLHQSGELRRLGPGLYFLPNRSWESLEKELSSYGLEIPLTEYPEKDLNLGNPWTFLPWESLPPAMDQTQPPPIQDAQQNQQQEALLESSQETPWPQVAPERLQEALGRKASLANREEWAQSLLRRKLFLSESQLGGQEEIPVPEARGMDYSGKLRIIEEALQRESEILEIQLLGQEAQRIHGLRLEKRGNRDHVLQALSLPDSAPLEIPVAKISVVRRLPAHSLWDTPGL